MRLFLWIYGELWERCRGTKSELFGSELEGVVFDNQEFFLPDYFLRGSGSNLIIELFIF